MSKQDTDTVQCLSDDLTYVLNELYRDFRVIPFGSIVTGLAIQNGDVDFCVQLTGRLKISEEKHVQIVRKRLKKYPEVFIHVLATQKDKVPIVKLDHTKSGLSCNLSFNSLPYTCNSDLIGSLLHSEKNKKGLHLAIIVKYWSKVHNLTGTNLMSSYVLTILVIFYLQQKSYIESIKHLQANCVYMVNGWNTAYDMKNNTDECTESLYELLGGFFNYYSVLDFEGNVVSPFYGRPLKRCLFENYLACKADFPLYERNISYEFCKPLNIKTSMCVQDPFEHSRNCTAAMPTKLIKKVLAHFRLAADIYEKNPKHAFLTKLFHNYKIPDNIGKTKSKQAQQRNKSNKVGKDNKESNNMSTFNKSQLVRSFIESL